MTNQLPLDCPQVDCPYCKGPAELLMDSSPLYRGRDYGPVWFCRPCDAWVGVHENSPRYLPLGRLANAELRKAKMAAHAIFDPLWQRKLLPAEKGVKKRARGDAYHWLAQQLGIPFDQCHIGLFDVDMCKRVVAVCAPYHPDMKPKPSGQVKHDVRVKEPEKKKPVGIGFQF